MPIINISKQDILRQQTLEPGWYKCKVSAIVPKASKDKLSLNFETKFVLDGDERELTTNFNSKAMGMAIPFVEAATGDKITEEVSIDTDKLIGAKLTIKVENEPYDGRLVNKVTNFLPYDADTTPAF